MASGSNLTRYLAIDCEMVGVGMEGRNDMLARVSIVNQNLECVYDKYIRPQQYVTDYRTRYSGIRPENLVNGEDYTQVRTEVANMISDKVLVGHCLVKDLNILNLTHPQENMRDTSLYPPFLARNNWQTPSLRKLVKDLLGIKIQVNEHCSVEDATVAMKLYLQVAEEWEKSIK